MVDELQIVNNLKSGNRIAFELLYNIYSKKIFVFALGYLKSREKAEGIVQIVFMKLWEKRVSVDENLSFNNFLYKIAKNTILNQIRKNNYHQSYCENYRASSLFKNDNSTYNSVIAEDIEDYISNEIDKMPKKRKIVFMMSRREELSNIEIAEKLKLSRRTVDNQIYKALKQLKESISQESEKADLYIA